MSIGWLLNVPSKKNHKINREYNISIKIVKFLFCTKGWWNMLETVSSFIAWFWGVAALLNFARFCVISLNVVWQLLISITLFCQKISKTNSIRFNMFNTSTVYMDNGDRETRWVLLLPVKSLNFWRTVVNKEVPHTHNPTWDWQEIHLK